jgi:hypothetical protein
MYISETICHSSIRFISSERKLLKDFYARLTRVRQLVTFGELNNDVDISGRGSMRVVASRVVIPYVWQA